MQQTKIEWTQLISITLVQGTVTLSWVIYALYLPELLVELGFSKSLSLNLLIIEHFLEMAIEPIFGFLSDRQNFYFGNRFLYITIGIILASSFFIALPIVTFFSSPETPWHWLLPVLAVTWASAMAIFRSPALALLTKVTPQPQMPLAVSCLTLVQQLVNSLRFSVYGLILSLGSLFTFAIGSFSLLIAGAVLRQNLPYSTPLATQQDKPTPLSIRNILTIFMVAIAVGFGFRFVFTVLPQTLAIHWGQNLVSRGMLIFSLLLALFALPLGKLATMLGTTKSFVGGLLVSGISLYLMPQSPSVNIAIAIILAMNLGFTMVLNTMIPYVLRIMPSSRSGLAIGTYFGGFSGALSFFDILINKKNELSLLAMQGLICFLIASAIVSIHHLLVNSAINSVKIKS